MSQVRSLHHSRWECPFHVVFILNGFEIRPDGTIEQIVDVNLDGEATDLRLRRVQHLAAGTDGRVYVGAFEEVHLVRQTSGFATVPSLVGGSLVVLAGLLGMVLIRRGTGRARDSLSPAACRR